MRGSGNRVDFPCCKSHDKHCSALTADYPYIYIPVREHTKILNYDCSDSPGTEMAWRFRGEMEAKYQQYHQFNLLERFRPLACTALPLGIMLQLSFIFNSLSSSNSGIAIAVAACRILIACGAIVSCTIITWSDEYRLKAGYCIIWIGRLLLAIIVAQNLGLEQYQHEIISLTMFLYYVLVFSSIIAPTYEEHLLALIIIAAAKPMAFIILGNWCPLSPTAKAQACDDISTWQSHLPLGIILCTSASVNWLSHTDRRKSRRASPQISVDSKIHPDEQPPLHNDGSVLASILGWEPITSAEAEAHGALQEEEGSPFRRPPFGRPKRTGSATGTLWAPGRAATCSALWTPAAAFSRSSACASRRPAAATWSGACGRSSACGTRISSSTRQSNGARTRPAGAAGSCAC